MPTPNQTAAMLWWGATLRIEFERVRGTGKVAFDLDRPITVIVGPNGAGKSTVLNQIRQQTFGRHIYLGPHRAIRRQVARQRFLGNNIPSMADAMSAQNVTAFEGIILSSGTRDAWELDEASNVFKYALSKMEFQRNSVLIRKFDDEGKIEKDEMSDIWGPLRDLTANLLPTLSFERIETENIDNMRCLFRSSRDDILIDFDELSSGEKSILQMLYPLIEEDIKEKLGKLSGDGYQPNRKEFVIIDEPELHLHPTLQESLLAYLRIAADRYDYKVVLATHSPTIIDSADQSDILLLKHRSQLTAESENQIENIADHPDKLRVIQQEIGSFFPATASRPVVFIEGSKDVKVTNYSDKQVLEFIDQRFLGVTVIPRGGKSQCIVALRESRDALRGNPYKSESYALVDRDYEDGETFEDGADRLPRCMVENLLLSASHLRAGLNVMAASSPLQTDQDFQTALEEIVVAVKSEEIARRFRRRARVETLGFSQGIQSPQAADAARDEHMSRLRAVDYTVEWEAAEREVAEVVIAGTALGKFSGKLLLTEFMSRYVVPLGMTKPIFVYHAAKAVGDSREFKGFFDQFFGQMGG